MDKRLCNPCLLDEAKNKVDGFCVHCLEYLCSACCHEHRKNSGTRGHKILTDINIPQDDSVYQEIARLRKCKARPEKEVEFECSDHAELLCVNCFLNSHRKCEQIVEISFKETTASLDTIAKDLPADVQQLDTRNTYVTQLTDRKLSSLQHQKTKVMKACSEFSEKVKKHIDSLEGDVNVEIEKTFGQDISMLQNDATALKVIQKEISFTKDMMKAVQGYESIVIRSVVRKTVDIKIREIDKSLENIKSRPCSCYSFEPEKKLIQFHSLGKLVTNELTESAILALDKEISSEAVIDAPMIVQNAAGSTPEDNTTASKLSSESVSSKLIETNTNTETKFEKGYIGVGIVVVVVIVMELGQKY
ncbi:transcription intermediary factor 1-alpha-like [Mya arenaria]|uniref:transcription intermediary factor 1-alpha-like n=1 Tax=Mya arenaria TaxID=6604 RepID=UPI0022E95588|nr:transcription intermediary factor 1-alpha-like [Mya arenaria]